MADDWRTPDTDALVDALLRLDDARGGGGSSATCARSASSTTWPSAGRSSGCWTQGMHYAEISRRTGASTATITRIASWLNHGEGGYRLDARAPQGGRRRRPLPARAPSDARAPPARRPEQGPPRRADARAAPRRRPRVRGARPQPRRARPEPPARHPVRAHGRRDRVRQRRRGRAGITGGDLLAETGAELPVLRELGYGRCRLAAAAPTDSPVPGHRRPRRHPRRHVPPQRRAPVLRRPGASPSTSSRSPGAVEVAPRLGLADAIVDLVSTGSTLVDERPPADRRHPRVRGGARRQPDGAARSARAELDAIVTMLGAVIAARGRKYLMMNAPAAQPRGARGPAARASSRRRSSRWRTPG